VLDDLKIRQTDLMTHDIGNMVGYGFAAQYPARQALGGHGCAATGIGDSDNIIRSPLLWHFNFRGPDEERLVAGRAARSDQLNAGRGANDQQIGRPQGE
jgi:hypothetical protein